MISDSLKQSLMNFGVDIETMSLSQVQCLISLLNLYVKKEAGEAQIDHILKQIRKGEYGK